MILHYEIAIWIKFKFFYVRTKYKIWPTNLIYVDLQIVFCVQCYLYPKVATYVEPPLILEKIN
jgi:hypothetical protein